MNLHRADMFEALRLTREGKLVEAMTVLRGGSPEARHGGVERQDEGQARPPRCSQVPPLTTSRGYTDVCVRVPRNISS